MSRKLLDESRALGINLGLADIYIVFKPWDWMTSLDRGCGKTRGPRTKPSEAQRLEVEQKKTEKEKPVRLEGNMSVMS